MGSGECNSGAAEAKRTSVRELLNMPHGIFNPKLLRPSGRRQNPAQCRALASFDRTTQPT